MACGIPVRTLQEFLADFDWDHAKAETKLHHRLADRPAAGPIVGVLDATGHPKQGKHTPGVQHQYCGQSGKQDNCVVAQHLLYCDDDPANPFACMLCTDLYLPQSWAEDRARCRQAGIPDNLAFRPKWQIGIEQIERSIGNGVHFDFVACDADYGKVPAFWFELDRLGQTGIGEVAYDFRCWAQPPACHSGRAEHASRPAQALGRHSPVFRQQAWQRVKIKDTTRGPQVWQYKAARVQLVAKKDPRHHAHSTPTERRYWLLIVEEQGHDERRYFVSNAAAGADVPKLLQAFGARHRVEQWFERAKQQAGLGAFEVRTYQGLLRHWLASMLAMAFLAFQTHRVRGEKSAHYVGTSVSGDQCRSVGDLATMADPPVIVS